MSHAKRARTPMLFLSLVAADTGTGTLSSTGWTPDNTKRPDGTLGPRSASRGFALPTQGTYGWHRWAIDRVTSHEEL